MITVDANHSMRFAALLARDSFKIYDANIKIKFLGKMKKLANN